MAVVDAIEKVETENRGMFKNVPVESVFIEKAYEKKVEDARLRADGCDVNTLVSGRGEGSFGFVERQPSSLFHGIP